MANPTCVACNREFQPNHQLVNLPQGRRVAVEPARGRVWRICSRCREWNLVGPEDSARMIPELLARLGNHDQESAGFTSRVISPQLTVIRVGSQAELAAGALALADRREELSTAGTGLALAFAGMLAIVAALAIFDFWEPGWWLLPTMLGFMGAQMLVRRLTRWRRKLANSRTSLILMLLLFAIGTVSPGTGMTGLSLKDAVARLSIFLSASAALVLLESFLGKTQLPSGVRIRAYPADLEAMRLEEAAPGRLILETAEGHRLDETDSAHVLTHLSEWGGYFTDDTIDQAHALVASTKDLVEFTALLATVRPEGSDLRLTDLSRTWWAALDLAITRAERREELLPDPDQAREVAQIAERLLEPE